MADISRAAFFKKLNSVGYKCFEAATVAAKTAGNPYIEIVHLINQVLTLQDSDVHHIINAFGINPARLASDMQPAVSKLPRGGGSYVDFSTPTINMVLAAWKYASLMYSEQKVRTGHWIVALVKEQDLRGYFLAISGEFAKIKADALTDDFAKITAKLLYILCRTDNLFPPKIAPAVMDALAAAGVEARFFELDSDLGHSSAGPEHAKWSPTLRAFLAPLAARL